jgi:hypothetical protein
MAEYNGRLITRTGTPETNFNTPLSFDEELRFQKWKAVKAPYDSGEDYDLRGAWLAGQDSDQTKGEHGQDIWKKPNHPTFSGESQYAHYGKPGHWANPVPGQREDPRDFGLFVPPGGIIAQGLKQQIEDADPRNPPRMRARNAWELDKK